MNGQINRKQSIKGQHRLDISVFDSFVLTFIGLTTELLSPWGEHMNRVVSIGSPYVTKT